MIGILLSVYGATVWCWLVWSERMCRERVGEQPVPSMVSRESYQAPGKRYEYIANRMSFSTFEAVKKT